MSTRVVIVGGLPELADRKELLRQLTEQQPAIQWEWIQHENLQFSLPRKPFNRLLHELRVAKSKRDAELPIIVKLFNINGKEAGELYREYDDPVLAPTDLATIDELASWLLSADAGIVPPTSWELPARTAGLFAALCKLVKNKSWNKDVQGHMWTKEEDLLGQAPVLRPGFPEVYSEAVACIDRAVTAGLLITKGSKQGKTPKELCINTVFLPIVKRALAGKSLAPMRESESLRALIDFVDHGPETLVLVDSGMISEKVMAICRERPEEQ